MTKPLIIPASAIRAYLKWLKDPRGVCFSFAVATENGMFDIHLPLVKVRK
jgi:hypothetical protein